MTPSGNANNHNNNIIIEPHHHSLLNFQRLPSATYEPFSNRDPEEGAAPPPPWSGTSSTASRTKETFAQEHSCIKAATTTTNNNTTQRTTTTHKLYPADSDSEDTDSTHSLSDTSHSNSSDSSSDTMNWFNNRKAAEQKKAKEEAKRKTQEAEIRHLYEVGTTQSSLEAMFSVADVSRVVEQINKEKAILQMLEAEAEAAAEKAKAEEAAKHAEIRGLLDAGTTQEMLEQMYSPYDVKKVIDVAVKERQEATDAQEQHPGSTTTRYDDEGDAIETMTEEEKADMMAEIKQMLKANTKMATMGSLYKPKHIEEAQQAMRREQEAEQLQEIQTTLSNLQSSSSASSTNTKLLLQVRPVWDDNIKELAKPVYHVSSQNNQGQWKLVFKSKPLDEDDKEPSWKEVKLSLEKLLQDNDTETPIKIELLQETNEKYHAVGHAETTLLELLKLALYNASADDETEIEMLDRKYNTVASLIVTQASVVVHQETTEEKNAKAKIAKTLKNMEATSKLSLCLRAVHMEEEGECQPFVRVEVKTTADDNEGWDEIYTSEPIQDYEQAINNPEWFPTRIPCSKLLTSESEGVPPLRISMLDWNQGKIPKPMGSFVVTMNDILWKAESNKVSSKVLDDEDKVHPCIDETYDEQYGSIIIKEASIQKMSSEEKTARANIANLLDDMKEHSRLQLDMGGVDIQASTAAEGFLYDVQGWQPEKNAWDSVFTSEIIKGESSPDWKKASLPLDKLLPGGDISTKIKFSLYEWEAKGGKKLMGTAEATIDEILLRSETSIAATVMADALPFSCSNDVGQRCGSLLVMDADIQAESEVEKKARAALASSLDDIDEFSTLHLSLKGTNLANMDGMFGVSDPFYFILAPGDAAGQWKPVYRSEHVDDNLNPIWKKARIPLQKLVNGNIDKQFRVAMYDWEANGAHQAMGYFDTSIRELLWRSKGNAAAKAVGEDTPFVCRDDASKEYGSIVVVESAIVTETADEQTARRNILETLHSMDFTARLKLSLAGVNLANMDGILGASDPFVEIQRQTADGKWDTVYKSEHIDDNLNPTWRTAKISTAALIGDQVDRKIRIKLTDWEESGNHQPMGYVDTTLMDMLWLAESNKIAVSLGEDRSMPCRDESGVQYGSLIIKDASILMDSADEVAAREKMKNQLATASPKTNVILKFKGKDLANVEGWFGCSDPFFEIMGWTDDEDWKAIYRSEHIENNLNPEWKPAVVPIQALIAGDVNRKLKFLLFDWEEDQKHQPMGYFETSLLDLLWRSLTNKESTATVEDRAFVARAQDEKDFGEIHVDSASIETLNTIATKMKKRDSLWSNPLQKPMPDESSSIGFIPPGSELLVTFKGINLANVEQRFGSSDPFFEVSVLADELAVNEEWRTVYKSNYLENCLYPEWEEAAISLDSLLKGGDVYRDILVKVFDWEEDDNHNPMGFFRTDIQEILKHANAYSSEDSKVNDSLFTLKDESDNEFGTIVVAGASIRRPSGTSKSPLTSPFVSPIISPTGARGFSVSPGPTGSDLASIPDLSSKENDVDGDLNEKDANGNQDDDLSDVDMDGGSSSGSGGDEDDISEGIGGDNGSFSGGSNSGSESGRDDEDSNSREDGSNAGSLGSLPPSLRDLEPGSKFVLTLMGADLANVEGWLGCSDPFFEISTLEEGDEENWTAKYTSEYVANNLSPIWKPATISLDELLDGDLEYIDLPILISIFDWEENGEHRPIGDFETTLEELISRVEEAREARKEVPFELEDFDGNSQGKILVVGAVVLPPDSGKLDRMLHMTLEGLEMANVEGWFGCSDPFFRVQSLDGDAWNTVFQSEHIDNDLNPKWKKAEISVDLLCGGDLDKPIQISIFDWDPTGNFTPMGFYQTSASALLDMGKDEKRNNFAVRDEKGELLGTVLIRDISIDALDGNSEDIGESKTAEDIEDISLDGSAPSISEQSKGEGSFESGDNSVAREVSMVGSEKDDISDDASIVSDGVGGDGVNDIVEGDDSIQGSVVSFKSEEGERSADSNNDKDDAENSQRSSEAEGDDISGDGSESVQSEHSGSLTEHTSQIDYSAHQSVHQSLNQLGHHSSQNMVAVEVDQAIGEKLDGSGGTNLSGDGGSSRHSRSRASKISEGEEGSFSGSDYSRDESRSYNSTDDRSASQSRSGHDSGELQDKDLSGSVGEDHSETDRAAASDDDISSRGDGSVGEGSVQGSISGRGDGSEGSVQGSISGRQSDDEASNLSDRSDEIDLDEKSDVSGKEDSRSFSQDEEGAGLDERSDVSSKEDGQSLSQDEEGPDLDEQSVASSQVDQRSLSQDDEGSASDERSPVPGQENEQSLSQQQQQEQGSQSGVDDAIKPADLERDVGNSGASEGAEMNGDDAEPAQGDLEKDMLIAEIRQLYEVGTQAMVLEQMFDPAIVAEVVAQVDGEKGANDQASASGSEAKDSVGSEEETPGDNAEAAPVDPVDDVAVEEIQEDPTKSKEKESSQPAPVAVAVPVDSEKLKALEARISDLEKKNGDLQQTVDSVQEENNSLEDKNRILQSTCDDLNSQIQKVQKQNETLQVTCDELEKKNSSFESICDDLKKSLTESEKKNTGLQTACDDLKESVAEYRQKTSTLESTCEELEELKVTLQAKNETLQKKATTKEASYNDMKKEKDELQEELDELEDKNTELDEALKVAMADRDAAVKDLEDFKKTTIIKEERFLKNLDSMTEKKVALESELAEARNGGASATSQFKEENEKLTAKVSELEATIKENEGKMATAKNLVDSLGEARKEITTLADQNKNLQAKLVLIAGGQPTGVTSSKDPNLSANELQTSRSRESKDGHRRHERRESKSMKETSKRRDDGERRSHRDKDREKDRDRKLRRSESKDDANRDKEKGAKGNWSKIRRAVTMDSANKDKSSEPRRREDRDRRDKERSGEHKDRSSGDKDKERPSGDRERRDRGKDKDRDRHRDKDKDRHRDRDKDGHRDKDRKDRDRDRDKRSSRDKDKPSSRRPSAVSSSKPPSRRPSATSTSKP